MIMFTVVYGFHVDAFLLIHVVILEALLEGCLVYEYIVTCWTRSRMDRRNDIEATRGYMGYRQGSDRVTGVRAIPRWFNAEGIKSVCFCIRL